MFNIHPLCSPRSTPTWPFDVKPPTYEPIGLIPTCEPKARTDHELCSSLISLCVNKGKQVNVFRLKSDCLVYLSQALEQTGLPFKRKSIRISIQLNGSQQRQDIVVAPMPTRKLSTHAEILGAETKYCFRGL